MASTERKSTYPPEADRDQLEQPAGTVKKALIKPGKPPPGPEYMLTERTAEQACSVAVPADESCVNETMTSK